MLVDAAWVKVPGLRHGFLDRHECQAAPNWDAVLRHQDVHLRLARPRQVHGATVVLANDATPASEADAVVATRGGVAVGIITADCVPILLRTEQGSAVAAVHAGWRGAAAGVFEATLALLRRAVGVEARDVEAVIGPAVGGCCYEVGGEVREALVGQRGEQVTAAFTPHRDRFMLDLRAAVRTLAEAAGVGTVRQVGPCTVCDRAYASYRRDGATAGRQLSFIALT
jgi:hypothetical protein